VHLAPVLVVLGLFRVGANVELNFAGRQIVDGVFEAGDKENAILEKELSELLELSEVLKPSRLTD
jgi:hypothetical protein